MSINNISLESNRFYLNKIILFLRCAGVVELERSAPKYLKKLYRNILIINIIISIFFTLAVIADAIVNYKDITIFVNDGGYIAGAFVGFTKILTVYRMQHEFLDFINIVRDPVDIFSQSSDLGLLVDVKECKLFEGIDYYLLATFSTSLLGGGCILPIIMGELPIRAIFPFDTTISKYYWLASFIETHTVAFILYIMIALDFLSWQLIRYTTLQLRVLSFNYINCKGDSLKSVSQNLTREYIDKLQIFDVLSIDDKDKEIRQFAAFEKKELNNISDNFNGRFKICVKHHLRLIKIVKDFNETFSFSLMIQLGGSLLVICLNGCLVVMCNDRKILTKAIIYLLSGFTQLLYWCAFGNQLKFQADFLTSGQWMSGWEKNFDGGIKNLVTTAMIKTMQPLEIRAGGLFVLTMETFLSILKSSYSVFVLLTTSTD